MTRREHTSFSSDFKRFFWRGLGIILPTILTLWIIVQGYLFLERQIAEPINRGIRGAVVWVVPRVLPDKSLPGWFQVTPEEIARFRASEQRARELPQEALKAAIRQAELKRFWDAHWYFRFIGLVVAFVLIYLAGLLLGGFVGRQLYSLMEERLLKRIPVVRQVYPHVKQVVDLILGERSIAFKKVVLVPYPSRGLWTLGFVTGEGLSDISKRISAECLTVFIPSTPTPFTGFTIVVPVAEVVDTSMTVDEAIRFLITGGVLRPGGNGRAVGVEEVPVSGGRGGAIARLSGTIGSAGTPLPGDGRDGPAHS